jgi:hypothetical protein
MQFSTSLRLVVPASDVVEGVAEAADEQALEEEQIVTIASAMVVVAAEAVAVAFPATAMGEVEATVEAMAPAMLVGGKCRLPSTFKILVHHTRWTFP